jgi:hypothetical protein
MSSAVLLPEFKLSVMVILVISVVMIAGCQKPVETPAKTLEGSYSSASHSPVYFSDLSDSCTRVYSVYDSTGIVMNWKITYLEQNLVEILATALSTDTTVHLKLDTVCQLGHQYSFPDTLRGIVGGTAPSIIIVERSYIFYDTLKKPHTAYSQLGSFAISTGSMTGTLADIRCDTLPAHCYGYKTRPFTLFKD